MEKYSDVDAAELLEDDAYGEDNNEGQDGQETGSRLDAVALQTLGGALNAGSESGSE